MREEEWDIRRGGSVKVIRCRKCCEGNNINPDLEKRTIARYMLRWRTQFPDDTREAYETREAQRHAEDLALVARARSIDSAVADTIAKRRRHNLPPVPKFRDWGQP